MPLIYHRYYHLIFYFSALLPQIIYLYFVSMSILFDYRSVSFMTEITDQLELLLQNVMSHHVSNRTEVVSSIEAAIIFNL